MHVPPPLIYLLVDLRPWLVAIVAAFVIARLARRASATAVETWWRQPTPSLATELCVAAVTVCAVTVSTPHLRFDTSLHGDEPKYLRFCLSFYEGLGFDLGAIRPTKDIPIGEPPHVGASLRLLWAALPREARALGLDTRRFFRAGFSERFNRAQYLGNWFIQGKRGGLYQVHNPGLAFALLPGFILDEWFFRIHPGASGQFPDDLYCTYLTLLVIFAAWTAAVFHVTTAACGQQGLAACLTITAMLSIPAAAMPFQIYPEILAGLVLFLMLRHVLFVADPAPRGAFGAGLLAGALPWLHIRFIAVSLLSMLFTPWLYQRRSKSALPFAIGCGSALAILSLYTYHITGSVMPTGMYYTDQSPEALEAHLIVPGLLGILFDRDFGLLPYSPIYLLAVFGFVPWIARQRVRALFLIAIVLALAVPSAGHSWNAAGGSPLRHLTAVVPLALLPMAEILTIERRKWLWSAAVVLALLSVQNAWSYNEHHLKFLGPMVDTSASGWKTLLLFPRVFAVEEMTRKTFEPSGLLLAWTVIAAALSVAALALRRLRPLWRPWSIRCPFELSVFAGLVAVVIAGILVGALTGTTVDPNYALK